ncbi:MAG: S41 family peptidase [Candidatus Promineifilaceae bacterium]
MIRKIAPSILLLLALLLAACRQEEPAPTAEPAGQPTAQPIETAAPTAEPEPTEVVADTPLSPFPPAEIINDQGGPVSITGLVTYTNPFFTMGVAEPVVILEDQAGFVDRNDYFLMPLASQTLGQITSDFFDSPFSYSISLPIEPQGSYRDVDHDGETDQGVQVYAVAYWTNTFGDPFLEQRDLSGGGWSTAYASTEVSDDAETEREIIGGKFLIYAPDGQQGFPSGFGPDGLLFTDDDPIVAAPAGYSVVDLNQEPFVFDRARDQVIDLIEPESTALVDYSDLPYPEAFDALVEKLGKEYAFTEYKGIDWDALHDEFRPRFEQAKDEGDSLAYRRALRDFAWSIPDGHVSGPFITEDFRQAISGGLGLAIRELDDGRIIVNYLTRSGPAEEAGIALGAQIISLDGRPIADVVGDTLTYEGPYSTEHVRRLQQLRYATRFPLGTEVDITWQNPGQADRQSATLEAVAEFDSFNASSLNADLTGYEQPLAYQYLPDVDLAYVQIFSFSDNELLTIQLWERLMRELNENGVPGLVVDMRQNGGGSGFLADQMAAYFFQEPLVLGNTGFYDEELDDFYFDPRGEDRFYLPAEELRYDGPVAVIVGPSCASACEFFSYDMTLEDRAAIVGHYPTAGLGGSIDRLLMPDDEYFTFTQGRAVNAEGEIHIEGIGVQPTVRVPVDEAAVLGQGDPLRQAAINELSGVLAGELVEGGEVALGDLVSGELAAGTRVRYVLPLAEGDVFSLYLDSDDFSPILALLAEDGTVLGTTAGQPVASVEELEAPFDLTVLLEVLAETPDGAGAYTLRIESLNN